MKAKLILAVLLTISFARAADVRNGDDVLRAMHDRYEKTWYETLTFTQKSTTYNPDGTTKVETWYEAMKAPGKLRIDIGAPKDGNGYLMVDGNLTIIKDSKEAGNQPYVNMLLVLGFDVYRQSEEKTASVVKTEGFDLTKVHEDTWEGQPVYVVGADKGDLKSKQFWIEKKRLLFMRVIEPGRSDPSKVNDIRFEKYEPLGDAWVADRVEIHNSDDKIVFTEDYTDVQGNAKLDSGTWDPKQFNTTHWEKQ
jgi:outer membrane lipoprotein-sorting protein